MWVRFVPFSNSGIMTPLDGVKLGVSPNEFGQRILAILIIKMFSDYCMVTLPAHQPCIFVTYNDWIQMYAELHSKHHHYIGTHLPQSTLWTPGIINKCTLREWFVPERIVTYTALKLDEDLHLREATFLLRRIQITVLDTKIITMWIVFLTEIEKIKCIYAIRSCNLNCISSWAGWQEQGIELTNNRYIPASFIPLHISGHSDSRHSKLGLSSGRYHLRNKSGGISPRNLSMISLARSLLASTWCCFLEL